MSSGQSGDMQLLYYLSLYVIIASILLSLFAVVISSTDGMVTPTINADNKYNGGFFGIASDVGTFITTFFGLLVWYVPASILPLEIQVIFVIFPKLCIAGLGLTILMRLIP